MSSVPPPVAGVRIPFREGFMAGDLASLKDVRLAGSRCLDCGISLLGDRHRCENCSSKNVVHEVFAAEGTIHTYTIQRYPPPQPHSLPVSPWVPRALAWVDLASGPRILAPIEGPLDAVKIGASVKLSCDVSWTDAEGRDVVAYKFVLAPAAER